MWWYDHPPMWGIWWIFPLMCLVFMIVMFFVMSRFCGGRAGFFGMMRNDEREELIRVIRELKGEVEKLRKRE